MKLSNLIPGASPDITITGLTADSREVRAGYLFAALPGNKEDGDKYIDDAIAHGAAAILARPGTPCRDGVVMITDEQVRQSFARACAAFYQLQPAHVAAVTGTSGKTSVVSFTQQLWHLSGITSCASLGTLGLRGPGMIRAGSLTTPSSEKLMAELADLSSAGITHLAMEASSHGLDQYRLDGVRLQVVAFTNLSRDHLDYHPTMDDYFNAKTRLFTELLMTGGTAVIAVDDEYGQRLARLCAERKIKTITVGYKGKDIQILTRTSSPHGQRIEIAVQGRKIPVTLPLVGEFQVMNVLTALGILMAGGADPLKMVPYMEQLRGVAGRLQLVPGHPHRAAVYVDYAHKPAALQSVLQTLRPHTTGKLFCVIGCGGDRDPGKRAMMGKIASDLADITVITDDNPRTEDPAKIRSAMLSGVTQPGKAKEIPSRQDAIIWSVGQIKAGDVLVIAGKGHEQGQTIGEKVFPFDDVTEAKKAMENLNV
ncbi:MAG: UDP-N-acetylmuramoyl-L-alanyl-D-glutamate--2,6-diaminopimelate ligase [Alphaproteobacteria bacterium]|nr:UDP-N-acetylmuramoyl-L-alanyl-D-glutamate--2,6-diaminopimelate ligase [Alphaproteobacteria bacterium]